MLVKDMTMCLFRNTNMYMYVLYDNLRGMEVSLGP